MSVTELVSHAEMSALKPLASRNAPFKLVSALMFHLDVSDASHEMSFHPSPDSHLATATLRSSRLLNVSAFDPQTNKTTSRSTRATITCVEDVVTKVRSVRSFDLENLADPELSQR
jgi:hypothetical protein